MRLTWRATVLATALAGAPVHADQVVNESLIVIDELTCLGTDCINGEGNLAGGQGLKISDFNPSIEFDSKASANGFPDRDWSIRINDSTAVGLEYFGVHDDEAATMPFRILGGAAENSLVVSTDGHIGLGTLMPEEFLHIVAASEGGIIFDARDERWRVLATAASFQIRDDSRNAAIFRIAIDAAPQSLAIRQNGDIVMGDVFSNPASLHVGRRDGTTKVRIRESSQTRANNRVLLEIVNKGAAQFALIDTDTNTDWRFQNFEDQFRVNKAGTGVTEMSLDASGNMTILGALTQNSDKNAKMAVEPVDPVAILAKVAALPVAEWSYTDTAGVRHLGPMAQDFHALFGLGASETGISTLDTSGVALAAIQALVAQNADLRARDAALMARIEALEAALAAR